MSKEPPVSVRELIKELNEGVGLKLAEKNRDYVLRVIEHLQDNIRQRKASKPKVVRNTRAPSLVALPEWEESRGHWLCYDDIKQWAKEKQLSEVTLTELIKEFRFEMIGKNKHYADFRYAFMTYLTKGFLSKTLEQVKGNNAKVGLVARTTTRGVSI
jgi:hypothetical protein